MKRFVPTGLAAAAMLTFAVGSTAMAGGPGRGHSSASGHTSSHSYTTPSYNFTVKGYSFKDKSYHNWSFRRWCDKYGCYCYYCPTDFCYYYWCEPYRCYRPISYLTEASPAAPLPPMGPVESFATP
jgi:hypothetical protein